jgi:peroxiredoxin
MNFPNCFVLLFSLMLLMPSQASPTEAQRIQKAYQLAMDQWTLEVKSATHDDEKSRAMNKRPDATPFARQMWDAIQFSLQEEWTLESVAWFLRVTPGLLADNGTGSPTPIFAKECNTIRSAIEKYHLNSPKIVPLCIALATSPDPRSLALLEKIQASHPDPKTQGVAALGAAMQLKFIGDDAEMMRKRLTYIRKAILQSSEIEIDGISIAKLAEDELYIIRFLTKGRIAPDLTGVDSASRPMSLAANKGKVIILVFWNSHGASADRVIEITSSLAVKFRGRPLVVIGVNNDPVEKLRALQADGTVNWPNFSDPENKLASEYRVGTWPLVYVLDAERKIHYAGAPGSFAELTAEALVAEMK